MKCSNCGAELKDGTLVCPRCGARQNNPARSKGSGSGGTGGFKVGKILAAVLSIVLVISASVLIVRHFSADKKSDSFTHNIDFYKDNLTVQDESTLRYREVPETQTFSVGSGKGFVNVDIVDEMGDKVNFVVDKTVKDDRYIIKPSNVWDSRHVYYLTLGEDTYFTDEAMFQFNKLVYSIKREDVAEFKYKDNIINIVENPNQVVKEGDVVITKDENGQQICKKVKATVNGQHVYETPDLTEVFEELNIHGTINPDLNEIFNDPSVRKQLLHNISQHPIFDYFVMTTYAASNDNFKYTIHETEDGIVKNIIEGDGIFNDSLDVYVKRGDKAEEFGEFKITFTPIDPEKYTHGVAFKIVIKSEKVNEKKELKHKIEKSLSNEGELTLTFEIDSPTIVPDIDIGNIKLDLYYSLAMYVKIDFNFDIANTSYGFEWEKVPKLGTSKKSKTKLLNVPINTGVPCTFFFLEITFEPEMKYNGELGAEFSKEILMQSGMTLSMKGFEGQKVCSSKNVTPSNKSYSLYVQGKFEIEAPLKASLGVKFALVPDDDIKLFKEKPYLDWINNVKKKLAKFTEVGRVNLYAKAGPFIEIEGKLNGKEEFTENEHKVSVDGELSLGLGISYEVGFEGELKIDFAELKAGIDIKIIEGKFFSIEYNHKIPIASWSNANAKDKRLVKIDVPAEGNSMAFGKFDYLVLKKDISAGTALLVSTEGVSTEVYDKEGKELNWAKSSLRKYLNGKFFDADGGFGYSQKESIRTTIVKPDYEQNKDRAEAPTTDKIFILSNDELKLWFIDNKSRELKASSRAINEGAYVCPEDGENKKKGNTIYWVRTQGNKPTCIMVVRSNGSIAEDGVNVNGPDNIDGVKAKVCVRPAFWLEYLGDSVSEKYDSIKSGVYDSPTGQYDNHLYQ